MDFTESNVETQRKETLRPVRIDSKWGYIDASARLVIEAKYESVLSFNEGLAVVCLECDHSGTVPPQYAVINVHGETIIPPFSGYPDHRGFSHGLLGVSVYGESGKHKTCFLDKAGNRHFEGLIDSASHFSDERLCVKVDSMFGFINPLGEMVISARFEEMAFFSGGNSIVSEYGSEKYGIINTEGEYILEPSGEFKCGLSEGTAVARSNKGRYFIDLHGKPLFDDLVFEHGPGWFIDGMAAYVLEDEGLIGFIDRSGKLYDPCYASFLSDFSEGLCAMALPDGRNIFINKQCKEVIDIGECTRAGNFKDGLAAVWIDDKLGYINRLDEYVWEPRE